MWWRKNPNQRIDRLLEDITGFENAFFKLVNKVELMELKISNALVKKKLKEPLENSLEEEVKTESNISPDGLDELRKLSKENG